MASRTPPIFATGRWTLRQPFNAKVNVIYTCRAIRSFDDLEARGVDVYDAFYLPVGLGQDEYKQDRTNVANIVTLMSDTHPTIYVPDTYIKSYPDATTMPYQHVVLSMSLGAVPDTLMLDDFKDKVQQYATATLGIDSIIKEHRAGALADSVDQITHQAAENNRLARIANNQTELARRLAQEEELRLLREQNQILTQVCIDHGILE